MGSSGLLAQSAQTYFNTSANHYVQERFPQAMASVSEGLRKYPNDPKLKALGEKMKKDQQQKDQQNKEEQKKEDQKKEQQNKDQQNKEDQQKKEQQNKEQQNKEEQEKKEQEKKEQQKKEQEQKDQKEKKDDEKMPPEVSQKLQQMKISPEKAQMILEAMRNQEIQYLQQNKRKATKPKDKGKPDW
jgi:hypothetical protein